MSSQGWRKYFEVEKMYEIATDLGDAPCWPHFSWLADWLADWLAKGSNKDEVYA